MQIGALLQIDNHTSIPPLTFLQAGCPSCCPTNSVNVLLPVFIYIKVFPLCFPHLISDYAFDSSRLFLLDMPSVFWRCWLGSRKGSERACKKLSGGMLAWLCLGQGPYFAYGSMFFSTCVKYPQFSAIVYKMIDKQWLRLSCCIMYIAEHWCHYSWVCAPQCWLLHLI